MHLFSVPIPTLSLKEALLFSTTLGLLVHAIYKRYEIQPSSYLLTSLLLFLPPLVSTIFYHQSLSSPLYSLLASFSVFYSSLLASIIAYRLAPLHPLYEYPGPLFARITKLWMMRITAKGKLNVYVKSLHDRYGPYVRIGPNEISCIDVNVLPDMFGPNGMPKGKIWDTRRDPDAPPMLLAIRDLHEHARQRKPWNRAFSMAAVRDYGPVIDKRVLQLANSLENASQTTAGNDRKAVDLSHWFGYFAFDFMGDMAFGGGFEFMRDGDKDGIWELLEKRVKNLAPLIHLPWATRLFLKFPSITGSITKFRQFTIECAMKRKDAGSTVKDLFYHLTNEDGAQLEAPTVESILSSGEIAVVAGSDTTANALASTMYYVLSHPKEFERLRAEVDKEFPREEGDALDASRLAAMPVLNAVINETLRLQPGLPTYTERAPAKGSGGHWLGDRFIPEGTAVIAPIYTIQRDPSNFFPYPNEFRPERWLFEQEKSGKDAWHTNNSAFMPFSTGPANCVGKSLALAEMRAVVAVLMQRFDFTFAEGFDVLSYEDKVEDRFIAQVGELKVRLTARK